jgi:hypothetical protein
MVRFQTRKRSTSPHTIHLHYPCIHFTFFTLFPLFSFLIYPLCFLFYPLFFLFYPLSFSPPPTPQFSPFFFTPFLAIFSILSSLLFFLRHLQEMGSILQKQIQKWEVEIIFYSRNFPNNCEMELLYFVITEFIRKLVQKFSTFGRIFLTVSKIAFCGF